MTQIWTADSITVTADSQAGRADGALLAGLLWTADSTLVTADSASFTADGGFRPGSVPVVGGTFNMAAIEVEDDLNGSATIVWPACPNAVAYNIYVNGALKLTTTGRLAYVAGLQQASYVNYVQKPSLTYTFFVTAIVSGAEQMFAIEKQFTPAPTSVALVTPMRRPWPFPNTGQTD
jgi:hypothetical protein